MLNMDTQSIRRFRVCMKLKMQVCNSHFTWKKRSQWRRSNKNKIEQDENLSIGSNIETDLMWKRILDFKISLSKTSEVETKQLRSFPGSGYLYKNTNLHGRDRITSGVKTRCDTLYWGKPSALGIFLHSSYHWKCLIT